MIAHLLTLLGASAFHAAPASMVMRAGGASAFHVAPAGRVMRAGVRESLRMESITPRTEEDLECIVNAENAAEQAACLGSDAAGAPAPSTASKQPTETVAASDGREMLMGLYSNDLDECLVEAENAGEVASCTEDYEKLVSGED